MMRIRALFTVGLALAVLVGGESRADITNLCPDGSTPTLVDVTVSSDPTKLFLPQDGGTYPLGRIEEGNTQATGTFICGDPQTGLGMRVRVFLVLPAGLNYTTCLAVVETPVLGVLGASGCATVNQAA